MSVKSIEKDTESLTMTVICEFDASVGQVWRLWEDPRQLERWWGPPTYPATVEEHDLRPGGSVTYFMTGPEGDRHRGWWRVIAVESPQRLEFEDGFADDAGNPASDMPTSITTVVLEQAGGRTRMTIESQFPTTEAMERLIEMGVEEGLQAALSQMDGLLAGEARP